VELVIWCLANRRGGARPRFCRSVMSPGSASDTTPWIKSLDKADAGECSRLKVPATCTDRCCTGVQRTADGGGKGGTPIRTPSPTLRAPVPWPRQWRMRSQEKVHRAGGAFVHSARRPSASAYGRQAELQPTRAPCSVRAGTYARITGGSRRSGKGLPHFATFFEPSL
jgi:hypothetical protein